MTTISLYQRTVNMKMCCFFTEIFTYINGYFKNFYFILRGSADKTFVVNVVKTFGHCECMIHNSFNSNELC